MLRDSAESAQRKPFWKAYNVDILLSPTTVTLCKSATFEPHYLLTYTQAYKY